MAKIASAGGAVIVAFMALVLSSLGIFRSIGPALAIAVAVTLLAALTLVPAVVALLGRALFWPSKKYLVEPEEGQDLRPTLMRACAAGGWDLLELGFERLSLEEAFSILTAAPLAGAPA